MPLAAGRAPQVAALPLLLGTGAAVCRPDDPDTRSQHRRGLAGPARPSPTRCGTPGAGGGRPAFVPARPCWDGQSSGSLEVAGHLLLLRGLKSSQERDPLISGPQRGMEGTVLGTGPGAWRKSPPHPRL